MKLYLSSYRLGNRTVELEQILWYRTLFSRPASSLWFEASCWLLGAVLFQGLNPPFDKERFRDYDIVIVGLLLQPDHPSGLPVL